MASTPSEPLNLTVNVATDGLRLTWSAPADTGGGFPYYDVFRGETADIATMSRVAIVNAGRPAYADPLSAQTMSDHDYYYAVRTTVTSSQPASAFSTVVTGHTPAAVTTGSSTRVFTMNYNSSAGLRNSRIANTFTGQSITVWQTMETGEQNIGGSELGRGGTLFITPPTNGLHVGDTTVGSTAGVDTAAVRVGGMAGSSCNPTGSLHIAEIAFDSTATIAILDMDYTLRCPGATSDIVGSVRFHSANAGFTGLRVLASDGSQPGATLAQASPVALTLTNSGTTPIGFGTPTLSADDFGYLTPVDEWAVDAGTCGTGPVAPGGSCQLGLTLTAGETGIRGVVVHVPHDGPLGVSEIQVQAMAIAKPGQPKALTRESWSANGPKFSWDTGDVGYNSQSQAWHIFRGTTPDSLQEIATTTTYNRVFQDADLTVGDRYYAVQGENWAGRGPMSALIHYPVGQTAPAAVQGVSLAHATGLAWHPPDSWYTHPVTGYAVYSGPTSAVTTRKVTTYWSAMSPKLAVGAHWYWQVAPLYDDGTEGPRSALTSAVAGTNELLTGGCAVMAMTGGPAVRLSGIPVGMGCGGGAVSQDGRWLAFSGTVPGINGSDIYVMPLDNSAAPKRIESMDGSEQSPAWDGNGGMIAFEGSYDRIYQAPSNGGLVGILAPSNYREVTFRGRSQVLIAADYSSPTANLATIGNTMAPIAGTAGGREPSASPDGKKVAYVVRNDDGTGALKVLTLGGTTVSLPLTSYAYSPTWSADGTVVFFSQKDGPWTFLARRLTVATKAVSTIGPSEMNLAIAQPDYTAPVVRLTAPAVTSTTATWTKIAWSATDLQSRVRTSDLRYRRAKGTGTLSGYITPSGWAGTTALSKTLSIAKGYRYCFSVRTRDLLGNTSAWTAERCITAK
jgi:hypothetical protein